MKDILENINLNVMAIDLFERKNRKAINYVMHRLVSLGNVYDTAYENAILHVAMEKNVNLI